jgi:hypothetical protein
MLFLLTILGPIHASYNDTSICTSTYTINQCIKHVPNQTITTLSSTTSYLFTKINHQNKSQPYAQYHQDVHQPRLLTNINKMYHNQDVLLKVCSCIYSTSSINQLPTRNVPSIYQSCNIHGSSCMPRNVS